jgi:hypothetical protein
MAVVAAVLAALGVTAGARADGPTETLTVTKVGDGVGLVTSTDGNINCGKTCSHAYDYGSTVTIEEWTFIEGSSFVGWSAACAGTAHDCTVSMNAAQSVEAKFVRDCRVPRLWGLSLRRARKALTTHDCRAGAITHAHSRVVRSGAVISQSPRPFTLLDHGGEVDLVISTGKP